MSSEPATAALIEALNDTLYALECQAEVMEVDTENRCEAEELCGDDFCANSGCIVLRIREAREALGSSYDKRHEPLDYGFAGA